MATAIDDRPIESDSTFDFDAALNEVAGHLNAQHARLVDLTVAMLADESLWVGEGTHTPELFLAWRTGLASHRARQIVAIARRADELPDCLDAFRRGELAVDQMAAIAARAPWWTDNEVSDIAKLLTVGQLRRVLARYPFPDIAPPGGDDADAAGDVPDGADTGSGSDAADPADDTPDTPQDTADTPGDRGSGEPAERPRPTIGGLPDPDAAPVPGRVWWGIGDDGVFRLHVECDALTGMTIEAAINEARDALFQRGQTDVTDVDAILEMAQRSLDTVESPARRDRFRTHIHLNTKGEATDAHGWSIPDAIRKYITCDGLLTPVFIDGSIAISVGRTQRMIPQRTRLLVLLRDQVCRVPTCDETHHLEIHHIIHWEDDGPTDTWNLIALCPRHHRMHHRRELGIHGNADIADGISFTNRHGRPIGSTGARPQPPGAPPPTPSGVYAHPVGERLDDRWLYFNPPPEHRTTAWANHPHNPLRAS